MNQIERMNRFRTNLLRGILYGFGSWAALLVIWTGIVFNRVIRIAPGPGGTIKLTLQWLVFASAGLVLFYLVRFWTYKRTLRKDPSLRSALDDERVGLAWLRAYRFAFFTVVVFHAFLLLNQAVGSFVFRGPGIILPEIPLTLLLAVLSCIGAFLRFSRED